jgi:hypothetical protein
VNLGVKLGLWEKVGGVKDWGNLDVILLRPTNDYGHKLGDEPVKISHNWYVWKVDKETKYVGPLRGEDVKAEIGVVVNPYDIVKRIKTGNYDFVYPGY